MFDKIKEKYDREIQLLEGVARTTIEQITNPELFQEDSCLSLVGHGLTSIKEIDCDFDQVFALDISKNPIIDLSGIESFSNLRILVARQCELSTIEENLKDLPHLFHINLAENFLSEGHLIHLPQHIIYLDVSRNNIGDLTNVIDGLNDLFFLYVSANKLLSLSILAPNLRVLMADHNIIEFIEPAGTSP